MHPIDEEYAWWVDIYWSRWRNLTDFLKDPRDDKAYLYRIAVRFGSYMPKLLYIGKVYDQYAGFRLTQSDHAQRRKKMERKYRRHALVVSLGTIDMPYGGRVTRARVDDIERLLIWANEPEFNHRSRQDHCVEEDYKIKNRGSVGKMYRDLYFGLIAN